MARIWPLENSPEPKEAERTAKALNAYLTYCHITLENHPINRHRRGAGLETANFLATQRCGKRIPQIPFEEMWGMQGLLIASGAVYGGLAHELGMDFERVADTSDPGKDLAERLRLALDDGHDFVHVHTKVPDEAAHTGDPKRKKEAFRMLDVGLGQLVDVVEAGRDDLVVAVTGDHSTPSITKLIHSGEPVPVTLVGRNVRRDDVHTYDEINAARGCLGSLRGRELMLMLLNYADRSALLGHHLDGRNRYYVPKDYPPFRPVDESS
jgi:2,3-bisphosphoglycerate-independent phosphoglycerate mutase